MLNDDAGLLMLQQQIIRLVSRGGGSLDRHSQEAKHHRGRADTVSRRGNDTTTTKQSEL